MADKNFGVNEINLIGSSGLPTIESPTTLNLNAPTVAISTNVTVGGQVLSDVRVGSGYSVGIGTTIVRDTLDVVGNIRFTGNLLQNGNPFVSSGVNYWSQNDSGISTTSNVGIGTSATISERLNVFGNVVVSQEIQALSFFGDGSYIVSGQWSLAANGTSSYTFTGIGVTDNTENPILYLARGRIYNFVNTTGGSHPFEIRVSNGGAAYDNGVDNNGAGTGVISFTVPFNSPNTLFYQCTNHAGMGNTIIIYPSI